jgi:hypothetical protein
MEEVMEKRDVDVGNQRAEDAVQGIEDELQNEKGDPEGKNDQDSREHLCPEMF